MVEDLDKMSQIMENTDTEVPGESVDECNASNSTDREEASLEIHDEAKGIDIAKKVLLRDNKLLENNI